MKFSVWDYSQVKIAQFNEAHPNLAIDPTDIFIFTWFKGFATKSRSAGNKSKGMWSKTIDGVDYFNIRYDAIIKDFPILGFCSVKSIQRRFDKYIEAGIFRKEIVHAGKKGNFTYFAFTDLFWSFEYDNNNPEHKEVGVDNSVQTKDVGVDNSVQTKDIGVDNSVQTLIYNPVINLNNSSTTSSDSAEKSAEEELLKKTNNLFGYETEFSPNPYPSLVYRLKKAEIPQENWKSYLEWAFSYLKTHVKNKDSFDGYFFKSFNQLALIQKFKRTLNETQIKADDNTTVCPVCGIKHDRFSDCPECGYADTGKNEPEKIRIKKLIYNLPADKKSEYAAALEKINEKYITMGMRAILDVEIRNQHDAEVSELNAKFNIA